MAGGGTGRTVAKYKKPFVEKVTHLERTPKAMMIGAFLRGLKENVKRKLRVLSPNTLDNTME